MKYMGIFSLFGKQADSTQQVGYSQLTRYDKKILIVDDDEMIVDALSFKLKQEGFRVGVALNGQKGLEMVHLEIPDLILLDLNMPVMDGITMLRTLRADALNKNVPVMILSNDGSYANLRETQTYDGAIDFIVKANIDIDQVMTKISNFVLKKST